MLYLSRMHFRNFYLFLLRAGCVVLTGVMYAYSRRQTSSLALPEKKTPVYQFLKIHPQKV